MPDSGSSSSKQGSSVTSNTPWAPVQPGLQQGINAATNLWNTGGFQSANTPYPGQTTAGTAPLQQSSWNQVGNIAANGTPATNAGQSYITGVLGGDTSGIQPLINNTRDAVNANYEGAGRYGSGANDKAVANGVGSVIANQMTNAASLAPQYQSAQLQAIQGANAAGGQQQTQQQNQINSAENNYYQNQQAPYNAIAQYMNLLNGMNTGGTSSTAQYGGGSSALGTGLGITSSLLGSYLGSGGTFGL